MKSFCFKGYSTFLCGGPKVPLPASQPGTRLPECRVNITPSSDPSSLVVLKVYLISKGQVKPANKQFNPNSQCAPRSHVDMHERTCERASVHAALTSREHAPYSTFRRRTLSLVRLRPRRCDRLTVFAERLLHDNRLLRAARAAYSDAHGCRLCPTVQC